MSGKTKVIEHYEKEINHSKINYKLLTPGPLTTSRTVKEAMLVDHCTWDDDFKVITQAIRQRLLDLAGVSNEAYTAVLMQGSGSFAVESVLSSVVGATDRLLICTNGAYGERMVQMAQYHGIDHVIYQVAENETPQAEKIEELLALHPGITALAMIHSETTSGILNPLEEISAVTKKHKLCFIVDAMSSFGGIPIPVGALGIDFLVSSANKSIQGVPGFGFVICQKELLKKSAGQARTLSMDLYDQFRVMDVDGKWRFTSPTHTVLAFWQALEELAEEGGIDARYDRYQMNNERLRERMAEIGFEAYVSENQGPFITSFKYPENIQFEFQAFYDYLKAHGYAIYPGKISDTNCFRIGNIGEIYLEDIEKVAGLIQQYMEERKMINVVILDWAGTAVDFGCMAPVSAFREAFKHQGITVTEREIREPMGMKKIEHIQMMLEMPRIAESWLETHGRQPETTDIEAIYETFEEVLFQQLANHAEVKPGVLDTVATLRKRGTKIGSTTGYTSEMMAIVVAKAKEQGYQPDHIVTPDEVDGKGRPSPEMLLTNLNYFKQENRQEVLKLGDTISDILEGKNAGVLSVGVIEGSSQAGYSFDTYQQLSSTEKEKLFERVRQEFLEAGADYVIDRFSDLPRLIETIEEKQAVMN